MLLKILNFNILLILMEFLSDGAAIKFLDYEKQKTVEIRKIYGMNINW